MTIGGSPISRARPDFAQINWRQIFISSLILVSWFLPHVSAMQWLGQALQEAAQFNILMLGLGGLGLGGLALRQRRCLKFSFSPQFTLLPVVLMLGSAVAAIALRGWLTLDHLAVVLFLIGTYGLIGLFLELTIWRRGLALAIAIACLLPFGMQFGSGLGLPIRILTAHLVEYLLTNLHISAISSEHIIVLENSVATVDLPCSGVKSLWTGTLFLLIATWLEGRSLGFRWLLVFGGNLGLLLLANVGRVLTLVILVNSQQGDFAELLHTPLGLVGFVTACLVSLFLLRWVPRQQTLQGSESFKNILWRSLPPRITQGVLITSLLSLTLIPTPSALTAPAPNLANLSLPSAINTTSIPLTPVEQEFFADYPGSVAHKVQFEAGEITGSWLLVYAPTWRAHHAPELCLMGTGYRVNRIESQQLSDTIAGRWLSLNEGQNSAAYWFQSSQQTTGDFLTRLWGEVTRRERNWVMVSVLFDQPHTAQEPDIQTLLNTLHHSIDRQLQGELS
ncbi:MAG: exosortase O [Leptolyngbyaceae cyanobacterium bins.302]|nr:exosortase O [Leptolyngbyaceae cyanobacterium bins.302]